MLVAPLLTGWLLGGLIANPVFTVIENMNPNAFAISEKQKVEGAKEIHKAEMRMRMDAAIGRAPPLAYNELQVCTRHHCLVDAQEMPRLIPPLPLCPLYIDSPLIPLGFPLAPPWFPLVQGKLGFTMTFSQSRLTVLFSLFLVSIQACICNTLQSGLP